MKYLLVAETVCYADRRIRKLRTDDLNYAMAELADKVHATFIQRIVLYKLTGLGMHEILASFDVRDMRVTELMENYV